MERNYGWGLALFVPLVSGCFTFEPNLAEEERETGRDTENDTASSDSDTDADMDADGDGDGDTDVDGDSDSDVDGDTDADTDSDTDTDADGDTDTDTDVDTDTDTDVDMDADTDTDIDSDPDTESDTESETATVAECVDSDTDACGANRYCRDGACALCRDDDQCGADCTGCSAPTPRCALVDENDTEQGTRCVCADDSCPEGQFCGEQGGCAPCLADDHCGSACVECSDATPECSGDDVASAVCACTRSEEHGDSCHESNAGADSGVVGNGRYCDLSGSAGVCADCVTDEACGTECLPCGGETPRCLGETPEEARCVACLEDGDCRLTAGDAGVDRTLTSPLGVCTPDNTCTCWVAEETGECRVQADCPNDRYKCAQEMTSVSRSVCFRSCDAASGPVDGLMCAERLTLDGDYVTVWVPATTCYAFEKFKGHASCSEGGKAECSVDGAGSVDDADCVNEVCTYPCLDEHGGRLPGMCPSDMCNANSYCYHP